MESAKVPPNEKDRLRALRSYDILDTPFSAEYDELCRLAATICGTPIALVSLVDPERQWFKSVVGLDVRETPRDLAFCAHAIWQEKIFEVPDATQDVRFSDNPLVTGSPDIRFYAGKPLITPGGLALGTLCVIDRVPKQLTEAQREALEILARQVMSHLELRRTTAALEKANREKEQFLAIVAHDLRSPLSGLMSLSDYLAENVQGTTADELKEMLDGMSRSAHHVYDLAENLLTWALLAQGGLAHRPELLRLDDVIGEVIEPLLLPLSLKKVSLRTDVAPGSLVYGDRSMIETAIRNLVSNAGKFSRQGQEIVVRTVAEGERVRVSVVDQGVGMSTEVLEALSDGIHAATRPGTSGELGSGLGLALVRQFASRNGGELQIDSRPGQGTTASLLLPVAEASATKAL